MKEAYPEIQNRAQKEGAIIHWGDEMGVKNTDQVGRSFSRKGLTPVVSNTAKRYKCNMISSITNSGNARFMIFEHAFTIDVFVKFLRKLIYRQERKIYLILDNHRVHHAKKIKKWLEKYKNQIELFFLPSYAPELNPDELLNQTVEQKLKHQPISRSQKQFTKTISSCVKSLQKSKRIISNLFQKPELAYIRTHC
tara:strand:- start:1414 stop:1998 length:585 start_codon:yes stop_codon:yes gene_type:complete